MCVLIIVSLGSLRIGILRLVKRIFVDTPVLLRIAILHLFSQSLSIVLRCMGQLLNVTFSFLSARCIRWPRFCPDPSFLLLSSTSFGWAIYFVQGYSNSNHCLFSELRSTSTRVRQNELRPQLIHWSLKYQGVEHHNLQGLSYWLRLECEMTFPTLCLILERWINSRV